MILCYYPRRFLTTNTDARWLIFYGTIELQSEAPGRARALTLNLVVAEHNASEGDYGAVFGLQSPAESVLTIVKSTRKAVSELSE